MTSCNHLMIDMETLDTHPSSVVLSCGLVVFNKTGFLNKTELYFKVQPQIDDGRTVSADTLQWWSKQGGNFERTLKLCSADNSRNIGELIILVDKIVTKFPDIRLWSNALNFDVAILQHIYKAHQMEKSWKYWNESCFRTFCYLNKVGVPKGQVKHSALSDAEGQAKVIIDWANKMRVEI